MRREFSHVPFEDPSKAEANLARVEERIDSGLLVPLASLVGESPDPDGALNLLDRYVQSAPPEVLTGLFGHPTALTYLVAIFGYSRFLSETLLAEPALAVKFARDRNFTKLKSKEDLFQDFARFVTINPDPWLSAQLARFKRRNTIRIVLKDVLGLSTLGETTLELSALADVILHEALAFCDLELAKRYGHPQFRDAEGRIARSGFAVVSLGKLGANELDYSSKIGLIFLYAQDGETSGGSEPESVISSKEYFVRLAHAVTRTVTQSTPQGEVFRVDLGLRPEGEEGELAISLSSALAYYQHRARDWELQMLIKARHSAGDARLTRDFLRGVEPWVYKSPTDVEAVESVLGSGARLSKELRAAREEALDVKLDRGGIRDIEFLAQCLQRLHGQADPWVRAGGTLLALRKLNDKNWISDRDCAQLTAAYEFLRKVEHRIQLELGHETHRLPSDAQAAKRLGRRAGTGIPSMGDEGKALVRHIQETLQHVEEIYQRLIHPGARARTAAAFDLTPPTSWMEERGPHSFESLLTALDTQAPSLAAVVRHARLPERSRGNVTRLFASFFSSAERFHQARHNSELVGRALDAVAASDYLADLLVDHPEDIAALDGLCCSIGSRKPGRAESQESQMEMAMASPAWPEPFSWVREPGVPLGDQMALLRHEFRSRVVALGAADAAGLDSIFTALGRWSALAARAVSSALAIARGAAGSRAIAERVNLPFAILALGRLGSSEFDLASDVHLVFVADAGLLPEEAAYVTRLASCTIEVLSSYTREGSVLAVDTRLRPPRPRGQGGELVVADNALGNYLRNSAELWEVMTYLKAWPVAGDPEFAGRVAERTAQLCLRRFASDPALLSKLREARARLEKESFAPHSNTETAPGGYYDLDFAVSYLRLKHQVALPPGANIAQQIGALRSSGLIAQGEADALEVGATFLRSVDHAIRLATGRAAEGLPEHVGHADSVETLARRWALVAEGESLPARLREIQQQVRSVYGRLVGPE
jgi:[glutamine synthetase] adenylyltransferase / [glutamine synthetase]-adenylyl-L-tyrosine phosphorylase